MKTLTDKEYKIALLEERLQLLYDLTDEVTEIGSGGEQQYGIIDYEIGNYIENYLKEIKKLEAKDELQSS